MKTPTDGTTAEETPWLGLLPYEEKDQGRFFGRSTAIAELLRIVRRKRLTVLYGISGIGKSSLLAAGLFPRLRAEGFLPVRIRPNFKDAGLGPGRQVIDCVREEVARRNHVSDALAPPFLTGQESLWEYFHRVRFWDGVQPLTPVLVFDQFEELFTHGSADAESRERAAAFVAELGDLIENQFPLAVRRRMEQSREVPLFPYESQHFKVVVALREDHLSNLERLVPQIPSLSTPDRYALSAMTGEEALEAVLGPGRDLVEHGVAQQIVLLAAAARRSGTAPTPFAAGESELARLSVEPFLLSLFCRELYARMGQAGLSRISAELVRTHEAAIIDEFYDGCFEGLSAPIRAFVEEELVGQSGYREMVALEKADRKGIDRNEWQSLEGRLVRIEDDRHGTRRVELIHDVLIRVVIQRQEARRQEESRAAEEARRREEEARQSKRRLRLRVAGALFALLAVALVGFVKWDLDKREKEKVEDDLQRADKLVAFANSKLRGSRQEKMLALAMAECATSLYQSAVGTVPVHVEHVLRRLYLAQGFSRPPEKPAIPAGFAVSPSPEAVVATALDGEPVTLRKLRPPAEGTAIMANLSSGSWALPGLGKSKGRRLSFSQDGRYLASVDQKGVVRRTDLKTGATFTAPGHSHAPSSSSLPPFQDLVCNGNGSIIATGGSDRTVTLHDAARLGNTTTLGRLDHAIRALAFSPSGSAREVLAVGDDFGTVVLWDLARKSRVPLPQAPARPGEGPSAVTALSFSRSGQLLAAAKGNGTILIWELATDRVAEPQALRQDAPVTSISFCRGGQLIVGAYADNTIRIWSVSKRKMITTVPSFPNAAQRIAFVEQGARTSLITLDGKGALKQIDLSNHLEPNLEKVMERVEELLRKNDPVCFEKHERLDEWSKCLIEQFDGRP